MVMATLLERLRKEDVQHDPFPHVLVRDALPEPLCTKLIETFPSPEMFTDRRPYPSNRRYDLSLKDLDERGILDAEWREFLRAQREDAFLAKFFELFGDSVERIYPNLTRQVGAFSEWRRGTRSTETHAHYDILTDAYVSTSMPSKNEKEWVRSPHVDLPKKLYAGLLYLRHPKDSTKGNDLVFFTPLENRIPFDGQNTDPKCVRPVKTIPYERNMLVLLVNSRESLHAVTGRKKSRWPRIFVNLVGELKAPLFDL